MSQEGTQSLLVATGQQRRLRSAGIWLFVGLAITYAARLDAVAAIHPFAVLVIAALGASVAMISALFAVYSIRCPKCGLPWLRWSLGHRPAGDWLHWLYRFEECPQCKHRAA